MSYTVITGVEIPMRDGVALATDVWLPEGAGPVPALVVRTPYDRTGVDLVKYAPSPFALVAAGYAVVLQDVRGTFASEGEFRPFVHEAEDGADTLSWIESQAWCDGRIGMFGLSYLGLTQWATLSTKPGALRAIAPYLTSADPYRAPVYSPGGAMSIDMLLSWYSLLSAAKAERRPTPGAGPETAQLIRTYTSAAPTIGPSDRPSDQPVLDRYFPDLGRDVFDRPVRDDSWDAASYLSDLENTAVPALHIGGWYDFFLPETLRAYGESLRRGDARARAGQHLVVGPWSHNNDRGLTPDRWFGAESTPAAVKLTQQHVAFFDRWVRGDESAPGLPPVRLFVMGIDRWRDEQDWPLPDAVPTEYWLVGSGPANTASGDGMLMTEPPTTDEADSFVYDPRRPVPSIGGAQMKIGAYDGPLDQRPVQDRADVLCFTGEPLIGPLEVTGPIQATLYVSSTAVDTDVTAKLVDVHPDGRAVILCDGILRMRYRNSLTAPEPMTPGEVYEVVVDLVATSNVFLPGHRIQLEVSSSNFPRYDRNTNTGGLVAHEDVGTAVPASNTLHRGRLRPSRVTLPVVRR